MDNLMGLDYLISTIQDTEFETDNYLEGIRDNYPKIIDVFFKLPYYVGELDSVDNELGEFHSFCFKSYLQAPYCFVN